MDLFDPKPMMKDRKGEDLPASIRMGQRLTTMTSGQKTFPCGTLDLRIQAAWRLRNVDERVATAYVDHRGQVLHGALHGHGSDQS